uniref:NAD(P)-binding domain-containing protein n=1 Tax=Leptocylindrus danicus TaxID=163516 RepID=A0A7S2JSC8_9STRA
MMKLSTIVLLSIASSTQSLTVQPGSTVGVVGKGFISILTAKIAAINGYKSWLAIPAGDEEKVNSLIYETPGYDDELPITLVPSTDVDQLGSLLSSSDAMILASDDSNAPLAEGVINFVTQAETGSNLKRIVSMSRNLNNKDYGFFVKASKVSSNAEVWTCEAPLVQEFQKIDNLVKARASELGIEYTIARAGTLKGGACGEVGAEDHCPQYLASKYYELTKRDIVTWQLLFDCRGRGVVIEKGDVLPGPGIKAAFTASAPEPSIGDTSRAGMAEAMVMSLMEEKAGNSEFGVGAVEARKPPTKEEWTKLFGVL